MWFQIEIPANYVAQKQIIRHLRVWIQALEEHKRIQGFAFNHYSIEGTVALIIRFDCREEALVNIKRELSENLEKMDIKCELNEKPWESPEHIRKAYEFGSRCAFLMFKLIENGRFSEDYISDFLQSQDPQSDNALYFQINSNHGVMNSLGIPKRPNEWIVHYWLIGESFGQMLQLDLVPNLRRVTP
ncbi:MAG: hypothetical protein OEY22_05340 [Candidatus Bathyarchaeota archaeon]|nr:hypothetical protein [Candidatus Bathyarchaeota archaeon]MDH5788502.1 hypothetical protein [Candidatus Bathyarchaeota archaeon]